MSSKSFSSANDKNQFSSDRAFTMTLVLMFGGFAFAIFTEWIVRYVTEQDIERRRNAFLAFLAKKKNKQLKAELKECKEELKSTKKAMGEAELNNQKEITRLLSLMDSLKVNYAIEEKTEKKDGTIENVNEKMNETETMTPEFEKSEEIEVSDDNSDESSDDSSDDNFEIVEKAEVETI